MTIAYIKDLINEYYKGYPWYDLNGKEISIEDFIIINMEEKIYEETKICEVGKL